MEVVIGAALLSQTTPAESFEAVAIKPFNMERVKVGFQISGARLEAGAVTLRDIIAEAYGVADEWISGNSNWMETERYNIQATASRPATRFEFRAMLQSMLADRFHLTIHHEPRQMKAYALVVDKGGPKLTPRDEELHPPSMPPGQTMIESAHTISDLLRQLNSGRLTGQSLGRPVVDRTGLAGQYHLPLRADTQPGPDGRGYRIDIDYFSAFRELGLRLDPIEEIFDRIVVDSATKPTPN